MRHLAVLVAAFCAIWGAAGCKPKRGATAEVKTLDSFASGQDLGLMQCSGSGQPSGIALKLAAAATGAVDDALRQELRKALSAVPDKSIALFAALGGVINLNADVDSLCRKALGAAFSAKSTVKLAACFVVGSAASAGLKSLNIVIAPSTDVIRHGLVRQFGFLEAQLFSRIGAVNSNGKAAVALTSEKPSMTQLKDQLARAFLLDLQVLQRYQFPGITRFFGNDWPILKKNLVVFGEDLYRGVSMSRPGESALTTSERQSRVQQFGDYVFAESFDSFYCNSWESSPGGAAGLLRSVRAEAPDLLTQMQQNKNTRETMRVVFPATYAVFSRFDQKTSPGSVGLHLDDVSYGDDSGSCVDDAAVSLALDDSNEDETTDPETTNSGANSGGMGSPVSAGPDCIDAGASLNLVDPAVLCKTVEKAVEKSANKVLTADAKAGAASARLLGAGVSNIVGAERSAVTALGGSLKELEQAGAKAPKGLSSLCPKSPTGAGGSVPSGQAAGLALVEGTLQKKAIAPFGEPRTMTPEALGRQNLAEFPSLTPAGYKPQEVTSEGIIKQNPTAVEVQTAADIAMTDKTKLWGLFADGKGGTKIVIGDEIAALKGVDKETGKVTELGMGHPTLSPGADAYIGGELNKLADGTYRLDGKSARINSGRIDNPEQALTAAAAYFKNKGITVSEIGLRDPVSNSDIIKKIP